MTTTGSFKDTLTCYSMACHDVQHSEMGDKIILPTSVLRELQQLKISLPFHFKLSSVQEENQHCGVLEFSAPSGMMFAPYWIMQNLGLIEGEKVILQNIIKVPSGIFVRFQPKNNAFFDLAATVGHKTVLETVFRHYTLLSTGETISITYQDLIHELKILAVQPGNVISLCGNLDLTVDFAPLSVVEHQAPLKQLKPSGIERQVDSNAKEKERVENGKNLDCLDTTGFGRRLHDGGIIVERTFKRTSQSSPKTSRNNLNFKTAQTKIQNAPTPIALQKLKSVFPEKTSSSSSSSMIKLKPPLVDVQVKTTMECHHCLSTVPILHTELHALHCIKRTSGHQTRCTICHNKILLSKQHEHEHCIKCDFIGTRNEISKHFTKKHQIILKKCQKQKMPPKKCQECYLDIRRSELSRHVCSVFQDNNIGPESLIKGNRRDKKQRPACRKSKTTKMSELLKNSKRSELAIQGSFRPSFRSQLPSNNQSLQVVSTSSSKRSLKRAPI